MGKRHDAQAKIFKALADASRLMILEHLRCGEMHADALLKKMPIAQSTLSHHMKVLVDSGIVECRKDGRMMFYKISVKGQKAVDSIDEITQIRGTL